MIASDELGPISDLQIKDILKHNPGWQGIARELTFKIYAQVMEKYNLYSQDESPNYKTGVYTVKKADIEVVITQLFEGWQKKIEAGTFLDTFNEELASDAAADLYEKVFNHLASKNIINKRIISLNDAKVSARSESYQGELGDVPQGEAKIDNEDDEEYEDMDFLQGIPYEESLPESDIDELNKSSDQAKNSSLVPVLKKLPKAPTQSWLTAVHMSWPRLSIDKSNLDESRLFNKALQELSSAAGGDGKAIAWLREHSEKAQNRLQKVSQELTQLSNEIDDAVTRLFSRKAVSNRKYESEKNAIVKGQLREEAKKLDEKKSRLLTRRDLCKNKILKNQTEKLVRQFEPIEYADLLGAGVSRAYIDQRRKRYCDKLNGLFEFGEMYQQFLRLTTDSGE